MSTSEIQDVIAVLKSARSLILVPQRWTKAAYARDGEGNGVLVTDKKARSWCMVGAVMSFATGRYAKERRIVLAERSLELLRQSLPGEPWTLLTYNDAHSHLDVLALFDAAILRLEATL